MFDEFGYPTEECLKKIEEWPWREAEGLFYFLQKLWKYPKYFIIDNEEVNISTGGWSGNEELIGALEGNKIIMSLCWMLSKKGGYYEFVIPENLRKRNDKNYIKDE